MVKCTDCGKQIPESEVVNCDQCGAPLCEECGSTGLCTSCAEMWEAEIDLADQEAEEDK